MEDVTLFYLCAKTICFQVSSQGVDEVVRLLPEKIRKFIRQLHFDLTCFKTTIPATVSVPQSCFVIDPNTLIFDPQRSVLAMEPHMSRKDFFGLCAANALDELTESTYHTLTEREQESLLDENLAAQYGAVVWCRAAELSPRPAIIPYEEVASFCAGKGWLKAMERSLQRVRYLDPQLLPRCALIAITQGQYHIANNVDCPQYSSAFHNFFPDGRVPAEFFAQLVNCELLKTEVGEKIASDLLEWLPKLDVNRLRRQIEQNDELQPRVLYRFDTLYNEVLEERDYSVEV